MTELSESEKQLLVQALRGAVANAKREREYSHVYNEHPGLDAKVVAAKQMLRKVRLARAVEIR